MLSKGNIKRKMNKQESARKVLDKLRKGKICPFCKEGRMSIRMGYGYDYWECKNCRRREALKSENR